MPTAGKKLVIAIDVGWKTSGFAYSLVSSPEAIRCSTFGAGNSRTPTAVLLDTDGRYVAFGLEAQQRYLAACESGGQSTLQLYADFNSALFDENLDKTSTTNDITGTKTHSVFDLFVLSIKYVKNMAIRDVNRQVITYAEDEAFYVIVIPGTSTDRAKWFLRQAAIKANIDGDSLKFVYESEACSLWCQALPGDNGVKTSGMRYVTVNIGGGLVDAIAHVTRADGHVDSLCVPHGGLWGGDNVDNCFRSVLSLLFGLDAIERMKSESHSQWLQFLHDFDAAKASIGSNQCLRVLVPKQLIHLSKSLQGLKSPAELEKAINITNICGRFTLKGCQLSLDSDATQGLYQYVANMTKSMMDNLLTSVKDLSAVIVVGEMANSPIIRSMLKQFGSLKTTFPDSGDTFSLMGATKYGHDTTVINSRVVPLTYGIQNIVLYKDGLHKGGETFTLNGVKMCSNNFHTLVTTGTTVKCKQEITEIDLPLAPEDKTQVIRVITCGYKPTFSLATDPSVKQEAEIRFPLPFGRLVEDKKFKRALVVGDTETYFKIQFLKGNTGEFIKYFEYK